MKRLLTSVLALSLLGSSVAMAAPSRGGHDRNSHSNYSSSYRGHNSGYGHGPSYGRGYGYRNRDNSGALIGLGLLGLFAATVASQQNRDYYPPPAYAPPPPAYDGYDYNYGPDYGGYYGR